MNRSIVKLLISIPIFFSLLALCSFKPEEDEASEELLLNQKIESFAIQKSIVFADKKIDLTRYDVRERFDREISAIAYQHSFTLLSIKRANRYFPVIESILKKNGVPEDFKYLALIESNFNNRAVSPVKAAGFWQLMPETAKELGLEVSDDVDERYDVKKSTEAACVFFKKAYGKFGDWVIVAASYNAGMGRLTEEIQKQQVTEFYDLWLNEETSRYVFRLLAMKAFLKDPKRYGYYLKRDQFYPTVNCDVDSVSGSIDDLATYAKLKNIPYVLLKEFNPWLRNRKLENKAGKTYILQIPRKEDLQFDEKKIKLYQKNWITD